MRSDRAALGYSGPFLFGYCALSAAILLAPSGSASGAFETWILFLGLLPLTNALFDFLSYGATIRLIRAGLPGGWPRSLGFAILDLGSALLIFTALGAALIGVVALANALAGSPVFPLGPVFAAVREGDLSVRWIYLMLFSTAVPTAVHLALASLATCTFGQGWSDNLVARVRGFDGSRSDQIAASLILGTTWTLAVLLPLGVFGGLGWALFHAYPVLGETYLQVLELVARLLGQIGGIGPGAIPRDLLPVIEV